MYLQLLLSRRHAVNMVGGQQLLQLLHRHGDWHLDMDDLVGLQVPCRFVCTDDDFQLHRCRVTSCELFRRQQLSHLLLRRGPHRRQRLAHAHVGQPHAHESAHHHQRGGHRKGHGGDGYGWGRDSREGRGHEYGLLVCGLRRLVGLEQRRGRQGREGRGDGGRGGGSRREGDHLGSPHCRRGSRGRELRLVGFHLHHERYGGLVPVPLREARLLLLLAFPGGLLRDGGRRVRSRSARRLSEDVPSLLCEHLEAVRDGAALREARLTLLVRKPLLLLAPLGVQQLNSHVLLHLVHGNGLAAQRVHHHHGGGRGSLHAAGDARLVVGHHLDVLVLQLRHLLGVHRHTSAGQRVGRGNFCSRCEHNARRWRRHQVGGDGHLEAGRRRRRQTGLDADASGSQFHLLLL
mmetsp:Transcript_25807/g.35505  ORF Transcript_25807/g.35505 Transcript_25807/m.35505 type:complete len:404 (+) Transcript_25807:182-1393(+)